MLTVEQITEYADKFTKDEDPVEYKLRLCYIKDDKLCRLSMVGPVCDYGEFTNFVNQQENLTRDMLLHSTEVGEKRIKMGTYRILDNGISRMARICW